MGVAGGYLLGRTRKLRLALALGGLLAGRKLASQGQGLQGLMGQGSRLLESNPQLKELQNQVTGHLMQAAREAALVTAASRIEALTKSLEERQQAGGQGGGAGQGAEAGVGSALGGVTGSLGLKRPAKGKGEGGSREERPEGQAAGQESDEREPEEEGTEEEGAAEQPRGRAGAVESGEEEPGEEEPGDTEPSDEGGGQEQPQGRAGEEESGEGEGSQEEGGEEGQPRGRSREEGAGDQDQGRRDRVRGRLRRRLPEGGDSGGSPSEDEATPRDVAKKVSAKKASKPVAAKGR